MFQQLVKDAVEWAKAHPKFSSFVAGLVAGVILGLLM